MLEQKEKLERWQHYFPHWDLPDHVAPQLATVLDGSPRDESELEFARAVEALPKVELHVHLEAAVPASYYGRLNRLRPLFKGGDLPSQRAPFAEFKQFIRAWIDHTRLITHEDDLEEMALAFVELRSKQNIVYTEAHISPFDFSLGRLRLSIPQELDFSKALRGYLKGVRTGMMRHPDVEVRLIVDLLWISNEQECESMMEALAQTLDDPTLACPRSGRPLVVALGLGGVEAVEHASQKRSLFDRYSHLGLKIDIHSGETSTASEHRKALDILRPDRVGHGIAPWVRPEPGVSFFPHGIAACPSSNILTGAFRGPFEMHPLRAMMDQKIALSVNTDDPLLFGTTLTLEYVMLRRAFGIQLPEVRALLEGAVRMAFDQQSAKRFFS